MATTAEIEAAIRAADKDPDKARGDRDIAKLAAERDRIKQGELFPPGPLQAFDDFTTAGMQGLTRGFGTKLFGGEAQDRAQDAENRIGPWASIPAEITGAVAGAPYRIGSALAGAGAGAVEGAATAYGKQKDWVPDASGWADIGTGAALGAGLGGIGAKLGEWWGGRSSTARSKAAQSYKTDAELAASGLPDVAERSARIDAARTAQGQGRGAFAEMAAGMDNPAEAAAAAKIGSGKGGFARAGELASPFAFKGGPDVMATAALDAALSGGTISGGRMLATGAKMLGRSDWANKVPPAEIEQLTSIMRDPAGRGIQADPQAIARARDVWSKILASGGRGAM